MKIKINPLETVLSVQVLVDEKLGMSRECVLAVQRPIVSWAASREAWPAGPGR